MSNATTVALTALLPHLGGRLPPRLVEAADSLVALSRQRAPTLKRDEEVARAHACAEIACGRLRARLRLPPVRAASAPAPARVYGRLLRFLDELLREAAETGVTARKRKRVHEQEEEEEEEEEEQEATPKRQRAVPGTSTSTRATDAAARRAAAAAAAAAASAAPTAAGDVHVSTTDATEAPAAVLPLVRRLCAHFATPSMAPHAYTGCLVALARTGLWPRQHHQHHDDDDDDDDDDDEFSRSIGGLVAAVWMMVLTRMMQGRMDRALFRRLTRRIVDLVDGDMREADIEAWVKRLDRAGWTRGQAWWDEVPTDCWPFSLQHGQGETEAGGEDAGDAGREQWRRQVSLAPDPDGVLLPGLGTMLQDAVDWLSDERTADFNAWQAATLRSVHQIVNARGKRGARVAAVH